MRIARLWLGLAALLPLPAQNPAPNFNPQTLLLQVRAHMIETLQQQPNYTCLETTERSSRADREKDFRLEDLIRLEVALVEGKEMFSWPGSKQFEDLDVRAFFTTGMFGTGEFGAFAKGVFAGRSTRYEFQGMTQLGAMTVARFGFRVPVEEGMRIQGVKETVLAGYHGSFYVQPETLDAVRLEVQADELPKRLDLREVTDSIDYARLKIGAGEFLLPTGGEALMVSLRGDANRNRLKFSACHEFTGQSKLSFGDESDTGGALGGIVQKQEIKLPKNATLSVRLMGDIDTESSAVGDAVKAELTGDVKVKGKVILPKGTVVSGRIVRVERFPNFTVLGLMFQEADTDRLHAALDLTFDLSEGGDVLGRGVPWGTRAPVRPHEGLVPLRPGRMRGRGTVTLWTT